MDDVGYEAAGGFGTAISHARTYMRLSRLGNASGAYFMTCGSHRGRESVGPVVAPFLSPTMWEQHAGASWYVLGTCSTWYRGGGRAGGVGRSRTPHGLPGVGAGMGRERSWLVIVTLPTHHTARIGTLYTVSRFTESFYSAPPPPACGERTTL